MTHLAIDIRLMAFKFFDLAVEYHPPSFFSYAEKVSSFVHDIQMFGVHFFIIGV
jgi:pre-rRNA-processing protein IPI1